MEYDEGPVFGLIDATISRDVKRVDELVRRGVDPCTPTKDGTSPIHKAALIESPSGPDIVSTMLSYGANPNAKTSSGLSPLHIAAMWGRVETIDVLLDNGADVAIKDVDDMSPLDYAEFAEDYRYECIDALTRYRADKDIPDTSSDKEENVADNARGRIQEQIIDEELELYAASESIIIETENMLDYDSAETKSDVTLTDVSELSDTEIDEVNSDDSSTDSFWSVSSVPFNRSGNSIFGSLNSSIRDLTLRDVRISKAKRNLTMELEKEVTKIDLSPLDIKRDGAVVIGCDLQEGYSCIPYFCEICHKAQYLISTACRLGIPIILTENRITGIGTTTKEINTTGTKVILKTSFSSITDEFTEYMKSLGSFNQISIVILFGFEAHISVQQTALDLIRDGYIVYVIADVTSSRLNDDRMFAFENIRQHGGIITTFESIWCTFFQNYQQGYRN